MPKQCRVRTTKSSNTVHSGRAARGALAGAASGIIGPALVCAAAFGADTAGPSPVVTGVLQPAMLAVVVNENDPTSVETGAYYQSRRQLPAANVIRVRLPPGAPSLERAVFDDLLAELRRLTPARVQAYALAWTQPYRVDCSGITSAIAFGSAASDCAATCGRTRESAYFDSRSNQPWRDHGLRPAMLLAGRNIAEVRALIDRGVAADFSYPHGTAYLARTGDTSRNVRAAGFASASRQLSRVFRIQVVEGELRGRDDVLAYFTGLVRVNGLETLRFLPGAAADHVTSFGGQLFDNSQMSALEWLAAGATASYGTVSEPCSVPQKFPQPGVFLRHYLDGATLIEAYWKSVAWPMQGIFVGEPLARPFGARVRMGREGWVLEAHAATPRRRYVVHAASPENGPAGRTGVIQLPAAGLNRVALPALDTPIEIEPYSGIRAPGRDADGSR